MSNILIGSVPFNSGFSNGFQTRPLDISFIEISVQPADISSSAIISVETINISVSHLVQDLNCGAEVLVDNSDINLIINDPNVNLGNNINTDNSDINLIINDPNVNLGNNINTDNSDINIIINDPNIQSNDIINVDLNDINIIINNPLIIASVNVNTDNSDINIIINDPLIIASVNITPEISFININIIDPYIIHECLNIDNPFFDMDSECKQKEGQLYDTLLVGAINQVGVDSNWYVTDYSTNNEKIFGEDNDRLIKRKFYIKYMTDELPKDERLFDGHGISGMDVFHIYIPKQTFSQMSQLNESKQIAHPSYKPQPGDIIQSLHNNIFYEVIEVKDKIELFLQRTHSWDITLSPNINKHYNVSLNLITDPINNAIPDEDILGQNNIINNIKTDVLFDDDQNFNPFNL